MEIDNVVYPSKFKRIFNNIRSKVTGKGPPETKLYLNYETIRNIIAKNDSISKLAQLGGHNALITTPILDSNNQLVGFELILTYEEDFK